MNLKILFTTLIVALFISVSCEKQTLQTDSKIDIETLVLVDDEVLADINFAELLDESDDGIFWGDAGFFSLKSAEIETGTCPDRDRVVEGNKVTVILSFEAEECRPKDGVIVIEYLKPNDKNGDKKKSITYEDFTNKNGVTFNGTKTIVRGNDNYNVKAKLITTKQDGDDEIKFIRNYQRQIKWICGLGTRKDVSDNIKKVTGKSEVVKYIDGDEVKSYNRQILKPLIIVKACALKIQAGSVKIEKGDGTELKIDYGKIAGDFDCSTKWGDDDCNSTIEVTKDGETFTVTFDEDGKRIKQNEED